jgi:tetratricopeptide (TPR) repeat protein
MLIAIDVEEYPIDNEHSYAGLTSVIEDSQGMMLLIIASCESGIFQDKLIKKYETELAPAIPSYRITLDQSEPSLRAALEQLVNNRPELKKTRASAMISVTGAADLISSPIQGNEKNSALDRFFGYLQWTREGLREFQYPIVLWVTPEIMTQLIIKAPDFWRWRGAVFRFKTLAKEQKNICIGDNKFFWSLIYDKPSDLPLDELLEEISILEKKDNKVPILATLFDRVGQHYAYKIVGDNSEKAIKYFQKAIEIKKKLNSKVVFFPTLVRIGNLYTRLGDYEKAESAYQEALKNARNNRSFTSIASSLNRLGYIAIRNGNWDKAKRNCQKSLNIYKYRLFDSSGMANSLDLLGNIAYRQGDFDEAEKLYQEALKRHTWAANHSGVATTWMYLGDIARKQGNWGRAEELYKISLQLLTELDDHSEISVIWSCLGENELGRGNLKTAETWLKKALVVMEDLQMVDYMAETNWDLAQVYRSKQDHQKAQEHYKVAHQLFTQLGAKKDLEKIEANWNSALN